MEKNFHKGTFIALEGLDGSGLSTQARTLRDFLIQQDREVLLTKEPTQDSEAGKKIRQVLDQKMEISAGELQQLFTEDRKQHLEKVIIPALKQKKVVICDRYLFSTLAFGTAAGLNLQELIQSQDDFLLPDLTFLLKVSPKTCINRIEKRGTSKTLFEKKKKMEKVWKVYQKLSELFPNIFIIDGEPSIEQVFKEVKKIVIANLG